MILPLNKQWAFLNLKVLTVFLTKKTGLMALTYIGITLQDTFYLWVPKEIACHLVLRFSQLLPKDQDHE